MSDNFQIQRMFEDALKEAGNKTVREALSKELKPLNKQEAKAEEGKEVEEKGCFTCKYGRCRHDGFGGYSAYCEHPENNSRTQYKYAKECSGKNGNEYIHWEPDCEPENAPGQSVKADSGKPQLTLVPRQILFDIAEVREFGTKKYGDPDNWKQVEIPRFRDAAFRHFMAYLDDPQGNDEESGLSHLSHLACNIAFLCELEKLKKENQTNERDG